MFGQEFAQLRTQLTQLGGKSRAAGRDVIRNLGRWSRGGSMRQPYSAAFISNPSLILSDGATG